jgi:general secretion pathway protein D
MVRETQSKEQRMKKKMVWLTAAFAVFGLIAQAEVVITSPTGLPDESDVVLESAVNAVKEIPEDTVKAVGGAVSFAGDEMRNTAHGIKSAFEGDTPRETARQNMLSEVTKSWDRSDEIVFRAYKVSPVVVKAMKGNDTSQDGLLDVSAFFKRVDFSAGTSACLQPEYGQLLVRNTPSNLQRIEDTLAQYHHAERDYRQVEIKAKFIEVSQSTLNELGFSWDITSNTHLDGDWWVNENSSLGQTALRTAAGAFGGSTLGSGSMVLTKGGWMPLELTISALEQNSDSDTLSAPSLTTMDGKAAEIWIGEDRAVPKGFDVKSADINIHIEHKGWNSELMGVHFIVTPEILKNDLIRLKLNPKIIDLIGYDTYRVSPNASMMMIAGAAPDAQRISGNFPIIKYTATGISEAWQQMSDTLSAIYPAPSDPNDPATWSGAGSPSTGYKSTDRKADHETFGTPLAAINGQLPYFRVREIKTQVDVADGSTVGLGGLIYDRLETYKDKVPVLGSIPLIGRLFRSEGERSIKRNLMIFVSAGQVANDGHRKSDVAINN